MYFQKLESLCILEELKNYNLVINTLDEWLATMPKSYADRITPESFANKQGVNVSLVHYIFDLLVNRNVFAERYILVCSCGNVITFKDSLEEMYEFIIRYNEFERNCDSCDSFNQMSTNNIFTVYKLIEKPIVTDGLKKKFFGISGKEIISNSKNLTERILEKPKHFAKILGREKLVSIIPNDIKSKVDYILDDK